MDEYFLHYLWKFQKFDQKPFLLTNGSLLQVYHPATQTQMPGLTFWKQKSVSMTLNGPEQSRSIIGLLTGSITTIIQTENMIV